MAEISEAACYTYLYRDEKDFTGFGTAAEREKLDTMRSGIRVSHMQHALSWLSARGVTGDWRGEKLPIAPPAALQFMWIRLMPFRARRGVQKELARIVSLYREILEVDPSLQVDYWNVNENVRIRNLIAGTLSDMLTSSWEYGGPKNYVPLSRHDSHAELRYAFYIEAWRKLRDMTRDFNIKYPNEPKDSPNLPWFLTLKEAGVRSSAGGEASMAEKEFLTKVANGKMRRVDKIDKQRAWHYDFFMDNQRML